LQTTPSVFSKEPRPVYYKELDILGMDKYWNYAKDDSNPYMWAEANSYWYRGTLVMKTKGGSLYTPPEINIIEEPESNGKKLKFVDINGMIEKNKTIMDALVNETIKKIYNTYMDYKSKIDVFYVAFSGGKDSIALLDVVQKALPHNCFKVLFGDTGMEFSDTYYIVEKTRKQCNMLGIDFWTAKSKLDTEYSWQEFGPPAQTLRWCCSVHKTTPQILLLRKILNKPNFIGMAFTGIRADESASRNEYHDISFGEKHKGQYSCNPILEWGSAELFLYTYSNNLFFNEAYKKGNSRVGCLVCPMASLKNEYMKSKTYGNEIDKYFKLIKNCNGKDLESNAEFKNYLETGGWKARRNGRELGIREEKFIEGIQKGKITLTVTNPNTNWKIWIKTIGKLIAQDNSYIIIYKDKQYSFNCNETNNGYVITIDDSISRTAPTFCKLFKQVFRKAACCVKCQACEANCKSGYIDMSGKDVIISDKCISCGECHKADKGCLLYKSVMLSKGGSKNMGIAKSLNSYSNHGPKIEWIKSFFELKNRFKNEHSLGSNMYDFFKRFLRDAELLDNEEFSDVSMIVNNIGLNSESSWGIILTNLSYAPQVGWYVKNIIQNTEYPRDSIIMMLEEDNVKEVSAKQMILAYKRILLTPIGENLGLGRCFEKNSKLISITRGSWANPNPLVILYGLYKFAEACGEYYQFTLTRLMNYYIDSDGVSPSQIFGLDRDTMERLLNGLGVNYPQYISASFTLNLDNITLSRDKTAKDILELF